jgi:DNA-binding NarL/FixJ family response regulator
VKKIHLIIIDDHTLVRQSWSYALNADPRFSVIAESGTAEEGIELCKELRPDVVMLDVNLPGINGLEAVPLIRKYAPGTKILGVSLHTQPVYVRRMLQNGATGYITKNSSRDEMIKAIEDVYLGKKYICTEIKNILTHDLLNAGTKESNMNALSLREMEIIEMIKMGMSSKEIAVNSFISVKTVEVHRYNILKKLNLRNAASLMNYVNRYVV